MNHISLTLLLIIITHFSLCKSTSDNFSKWFIQNEDSIYADFNRASTTNEIEYVETTAKNEYRLCIQTPLKLSKSNYWLSEFTKKVKKQNESLIVKFWYDQCHTPNARIEISTGYKTSLVKSLDQVLTDVPFPKYFKIDKYIQPDTSSQIIVLNSFVEISIKDIRIKINDTNGQKELTIFLFTEVEIFDRTQWSQHFVKETLFGEELLLKRIGKVKFVKTDSIDNRYYTVQQIRERLKI